MIRKPIYSAALLGAVLCGTVLRAQTPPAPAHAAASADNESFVENPFHLGSLLQDTNGDGIADAVCGHIIVPANPSAAENAAAANLAARIGYESSALTLPIVIQGAPRPVTGCVGAQQNIWIGAGALPAEVAAGMKKCGCVAGSGRGRGGCGEGRPGDCGSGPGGTAGGGECVCGAGAVSVGDSGREESCPGEECECGVCEGQCDDLGCAEGAGVCAECAGVRRAVLTVEGTTDALAVQKVLRPEEGTPVSFGSVREVELLLGETPLVLANAGGAVRAAALPAMPEAAGRASGRPLDLARLYTVKGLLDGEREEADPIGYDGEAVCLCRR